MPVKVVVSVRHAVDAVCRHFGTDINALIDYHREIYIDDLTDGFSDNHFALANGKIYI